MCMEMIKRNTVGRHPNEAVTTPYRTSGEGPSDIERERERQEAEIREIHKTATDDEIRCWDRMLATARGLPHFCMQNAAREADRALVERRKRFGRR
jgi:hypothetical protein